MTWRRLNHMLFTHKRHMGFSEGEVPLIGTESCQFYFGDEIILEVFQGLFKLLTISVSLLKMENPAVC